MAFNHLDRLTWAAASVAPVRQALGIVHKALLNPINRVRHASKQTRCLEIGPGRVRIPGYETANIVWTPITDYVCNSSKRLPFRAETFNSVYASHILEHIPWYMAANTLKEWCRIIKPGGTLELWVPDGEKICRAFLDAENCESDEFQNDGWFKFNDDEDPAIWANGRIFSYGDGKGTLGHQNWHLALHNERLLTKLLAEAGFHSVEKMQSDEVRGYDHGWINLGIRAQKPLR
ncbi:class I SAM-dependent methyltransferase [Qipengyuania aquimaris]|uniref:Methyltransferase domain-containing protein n=1 Tax=Qipengyuania aquimaris TaxID=255984 RepID=A0A9Q3S0D4_9SPHN|nr:methyltransferase domain-containing protein [Qipengyuania aquimaris]MBY6217889.1 methyltransferase domain-containing protein [Qipengyuania aquimaris]